MQQRQNPIAFALSLPEIVSEITTNLSRRDLVSACLVNHLWYYESMRNLWLKVEFLHSYGNRYDVNNIINSNKDREKAVIKFATQFSRDKNPRFSYRLQHLVIEQFVNYGKWKPKFEKVLIAIIKSCPNLRLLDLKSCTLSDEGVNVIAHTCPNLEFLNIDGCNLEITDESIRNIANSCPRLRYFSFIGCQVSLETLDLIKHTYPNMRQGWHVCHWVEKKVKSIYDYPKIQIE